MLQSSGASKDSTEFDMCMKAFRKKAFSYMSDMELNELAILIVRDTLKIKGYTHQLFSMAERVYSTYLGCNDEVEKPQIVEEKKVNPKVVSKNPFSRLKI